MKTLTWLTIIINLAAVPAFAFNFKGKVTRKFIHYDSPREVENFIEGHSNLSCRFGEHEYPGPPREKIGWVKHAYGTVQRIMGERITDNYSSGPISEHGASLAMETRYYTLVLFAGGPNDRGSKAVAMTCTSL